VVIGYRGLAAIHRDAVQLTADFVAAADRRGGDSPRALVDIDAVGARRDRVAADDGIDIVLPVNTLIGGQIDAVAGRRDRVAGDRSAVRRAEAAADFDADRIRAGDLIAGHRH